MTALQKLEETLDDIFDKKAPIKIPPEGRRALARSFWWIALVVGLLQLWAAVSLWQWGHTTDHIISTTNEYYTAGYVRHLGLFYYASLMAMGGGAVILLVAASALKAMKRVGWEYLYYSVVLEVIIAVCQLFADGGGFISFIGSLIGAAIGAFMIFQVRDQFKGGAPSH